MNIGPHGFDVTQCILRAHLGPDKFFWTLRVYAQGTLHGEAVEPNACSENLLSLFNKKFRTWKEALGAPISWQSCYHHIHERTEATLFVYSYEDIEQATLKLTPTGPTTFELHWTGTTDISSEEFDDIDNLPLKILADGTFDGVEVYGLADHEALPRLKEYLADDVFQFTTLLPDSSLLYAIAP